MSTEVVARNFIKAFRALKKSERENILKLMLDNKKLYEDIYDSIIARQRLREKGRPLEKFESELKRNGRL